MTGGPAEEHRWSDGQAEEGGYGPTPAVNPVEANSYD